ncbi:helix-turn-helix domain-containing protein [Microvirga sp. STR05]|uniref:Helix-turn-helix domain-containing protein n=1 Tax=Hymenobacter duratus TaxID=2771356 RepID=A0ABR8JE11_9BACT|nr:helix-turn-helix transcriptional regulator [Hymenobacter duratus]MBD2715084.1 helix-turn-helix domain-containing protein [Hymenobacter duratus]MBR7949990.1 helix-turn-helix domain-containing protein [Microvirga sp. STR05]
MWFGFNMYSGVLLPFFVQGLVVAAVLWARRRREGTAADGWLALLLLLFAGRLAQWMLGFAGWYDAHDARTTFMFYWPFSNWLAVGPGLYFYFRSLTNQEFRLECRHGWHFGPALALLLWRLLVFGYDIGWWHGVQHQPLPEHFGTKGPLAFWADQQPVYYLADALGYLSVLAYAVRSLREYRAYARYLNDNFSDTEKIRFRWLRNVLVAVVVGTGITLAFGLIGSFVSPLSYYEAWYDYLFTGLLIYYLSIAGLLTGHRLAALRFQPTSPTDLTDTPLATHPEQIPAALVSESFNTTGPPQTYGPAAQPTAATSATADSTGSPIPAPVPEPAEADAELARWTKRLLHHMQVAHPYLEPELTLGELAAQLRTNTSWLSKVINTGCGQNFNDFINEYRVREAERCLRDPKFRHYTLLAVALEAGFNSKSTFNRVFKKLRGLTPSEVAREE